MDTVSENIEEARRLMTAGDDRRAADLLTLAASECHDPGSAALSMVLPCKDRSAPDVSRANAGTRRSACRSYGLPESID